MCKISSGEGNQLGDLSTLADPSVVDAIKARVASLSQLTEPPAGLLERSQ